jgi:hypothetical protein
MYQVTFLPILLASVLAAGIGFVWYHPRVFGTIWMRASGVTPEMVERGKRRMPIYGFLGLLASMVVAYVMNYFGIAWGVYDWHGALQLAFWCWAGFIAPVMLGMVLWEQKPFRAYFINVTYWLVALCVMALVLVQFPTL